jgi:hypothetical protein
MSGLPIINRSGKEGGFRGRWRPLSAGEEIGRTLRSTASGVAVLGLVLLGPATLSLRASLRPAGTSVSRRSPGHSTFSAVTKDIRLTVGLAGRARDVADIQQR